MKNPPIVNLKGKLPLICQTRHLWLAHLLVETDQVVLSCERTGQFNCDNRSKQHVEAIYGSFIGPTRTLLDFRQHKLRSILNFGMAYSIHILQNCPNDFVVEPAPGYMCGILVSKPLQHEQEVNFCCQCEYKCLTCNCGLRMFFTFETDDTTFNRKQCNDFATLDERFCDNFFSEKKLNIAFA